MSPQEIITAPYSIWLAPVGTPFPRLHEEPQAPWQALGTSGARSQSEGGVTTLHSQTHEQPKPADKRTSSTSFVSDEQFRVRVELLDMTLEQLQHILGGNQIVQTAPSLGVPGAKRIGLSMAPRVNSAKAMLIRGPSPYAGDLVAQYEVPRTQQIGSPSPVFRKGSPAALALEFVALEDPDAASEEELFGRLIAQGDTNVTLKLAGTGLRLPTSVVTVSGNNYRGRDVVIGLPDYELSEFYFFIAAFACPSPALGGEVKCTSTITLEGVAVRTLGGDRVICQMDDGTAPIVIDPSVSATEYGKWVKVTAPSALAASSTAIFSFVGHVSNGTFPGVVGGGTEVESIFGGIVPGAESEGSDTSLLSKLSGNTQFSNSGGPGISPSAMLVETPPGFLSGAGFGDSVAFGDGQTDDKSFRTSRNAFGFLEMGMDDDTESDRINFLNWCIPGYGFLENSGTEPDREPVTSATQGNALAMPGQIWALQKGVELNGGRPIADFGIMQHLTNSSTSILANQEEGYRNACAVLRSSVGGDASFPVFGVKPPQNVDSTNRFADVAGQSPSDPQQDYPDGRRWLMIEKIGGDGVENDPTAEFQADGTLQGSMNLWAVSAADLTTQRDLVSTFPFSASLTSAYNGSGPVMMDADPGVGVSLVFDDGTVSGNTGAVVSVTGTGPYAVEMAWFTSGVALSSGASVTRSWFDGGQHPGGPISHKEYADKAVVPFKVAQGWVPDDAVPNVSNVQINGTPQDDQTLTVTYTVTGFPVPDVEVQWDFDGSDITGETGDTIDLDASAMGLTAGGFVGVSVKAKANGVGPDDTGFSAIKFVVPVPAAAPKVVDSVSNGGSAGTATVTGLIATGSDRQVLAKVGAGTSDAINDISCTITGSAGTANMPRVLFSGTNNDNPANATEVGAAFLIKEAALAAIGSGPYSLTTTATGSNTPDKIGIGAISVEDAPQTGVVASARSSTVSATPTSANTLVLGSFVSNNANSGATLTGGTLLENLSYGDGLIMGWAEQGASEITMTSSLGGRALSALILLGPGTV